MTISPRRVTVGLLSLTWLATTAALATDGEGKLPVQYRDKPFAVTFASQADIWVVGDFGLMLYSPDGGASWERRTRQPRTTKKRFSTLRKTMSSD